MPGIITDVSERFLRNEEPSELNSSYLKENNTITRSPREISASPLTPQSSAFDLPMENCVDTSIERLYDNVCEMESSSNGSPSHRSFGSDGEESRIDSELCHLVGGEVKKTSEIVEEGDESEMNNSNNVVIEREYKIGDRKSPTKSSVSSKKSKKPPRSEMESDASMKSSPKNNESVTKSVTRAAARKQKGGIVDSAEDGAELGPFLLKHARDLISSDNHRRALKYALRAAKVFERITEGKPSLDLVMSLHVIAAIQCSLGKYSEAIALLEKSIGIPDLEEGEDHALAKFSGCMQLGDTYAMVGQLESSIQCYTTGLDIQRKVLGATDPRVGETCRYGCEKGFIFANNSCSD